MRQVLTFLKILEETFPYVGMNGQFRGAHAITLSKEKDNGVDILVWHLGRAWPCTATIDEFEIWDNPGGSPDPLEVRPKTDEELKAFARKMKEEIEKMAAAKLAQVR